MAPLSRTISDGVRKSHGPVAVLPYSHPRHLNQRIGRIVLSATSARPHWYPYAQLSSGMFLKFIRRCWRRA